MSLFVVIVIIVIIFTLPCRCIPSFASLSPSLNTELFTDVSKSLSLNLTISNTVPLSQSTDAYVFFRLLFYTITFVKEGKGGDTVTCEIWKIYERIYFQNSLHICVL